MIFRSATPYQAASTRRVFRVRIAFRSTPMRRPSYALSIIAARLSGDSCIRRAVVAGRVL
jgi:hypothetical protein